MKKTQILYMALAVMFIINIAWLFFYFFCNKHQSNDGPKSLIIEKLNFDQAQVAQYEVLILEHRSAISQANEELQGFRSSLFHSLINETIMPNDSILNLLANKQIEIEKIHFTHFQQIKAICTENQLDSFNQLCLELANLFKGHRDNKKK